MAKFQYKGKEYGVDATGYLLDSAQWDEGFAEGMAPQQDIPGGLTDAHWKVLRYIRDADARTGTYPLVYQACKANNLRLADFQRLFPHGYLRGACLLAGITSRKGHDGIPDSAPEKVYRIDVRGFLIDPAEWDEGFAARRAEELGIPGGLTEKHWQVIRYLRRICDAKAAVPTVYEACQANGIELEELERLFPTGYHRGAVKVAGLRAR